MRVRSLPNIITVLLGLLLALLFNQRIRGIRVLRALFTLPLFATPVAIGYLAITIYDEDTGPVNALLTSQAAIQGARASLPAA